MSRVLPKHWWDKTRKRVYAEYGHRCGVCGSDPKELAPERDPALLPERLRNFLERGWCTEEEIWWRHPPTFRLECHEEWEYDEATYTQNLVNLIALCTPCHQIKHWHLPYLYWLNEKDYARLPHKSKGEWRWNGHGYYAWNGHGFYLQDHFMRVNECTPEVMWTHVQEAAELDSRRSQVEWQVNFGEFV